MKISTEAILTGIYRVPATPVQIAICRARDGVPLGPELTANADVQTAFGGPEAVAALPGERGIKPEETWIIASARTAKTTIAVAGGLADLMGLDLSSLGPGEVPRLSITSVKLDTADVPYKRLSAAFESPLLRPLLIEQRDSDRMLVVRHPSGTPLEIAVVAGGRAAGGLASRWCAGFIPDECCKQAGRDDAVTNLDDCLSVVRERMLPGAAIAPVGSPWAPSGTAYDVVQQYFGKPTAQLIVVRMTGPVGNPTYWTPERLDTLQAKDEAAWRINALGEFIAPESGLLSPIAVHRNTRETPLELPREAGARYVAAVDPSEGGEVGNGFCLVIVKFEPPQLASQKVKYRVAFSEDFRGLGIEALWQAIASRCQRYGISHAWTDQYSAAASTALAKRYGLTLRVDKTSATSKLEDFTNFATLAHTDAIEFSPDRALRRDLLAVKRRATQSGMTIVLPKTNDGRHADFAPALVAAIKHAREAERSNAYAIARAHRHDMPHARDMASGDETFHWLPAHQRGRYR